MDSPNSAFNPELLKYYPQADESHAAFVFKLQPYITPSNRYKLPGGEAENEKIV